MNVLDHDRRAVHIAPDLPGWPVTAAARAAAAVPVLAVFSFAVGLPTYAAALPDIAGSARWLLATATSLVVLLMLALTLVSLHARQVAAMPGWGHAAAAVALVGTILAAGGAWDSVFTVTYLAQVTPAALEPATSGALLAGFVLSYAVLVVGWAGFALATLRARVLRRGPAITLLCGSLVALVPAPTSLRVLPLAVAAALLARRT